MWWTFGILFSIPFLLMGLMVYLIIMLKMNKTNRFVEWCLKKTKPNPKELIFYNFWGFGVLPFIMGILGWFILWTTPELPIFSFTMLFIMSVSVLLIGEMRIFIYYDKYFVQKNFGKDEIFEEYTKHIDMKLKLKSYTSELYNSHRPPWYKDKQLWMMF